MFDLMAMRPPSRWCYLVCCIFQVCWLYGAEIGDGVYIMRKSLEGLLGGRRDALEIGTVLLLHSTCRASTAAAVSQLKIVTLTVSSSIDCLRRVCSPWGPCNLPALTRHSFDSHHQHLHSTSHSHQCPSSLFHPFHGPLHHLLRSWLPLSGLPPKL
jgi:hypothetical protein